MANTPHPIGIYVRVSRKGDRDDDKFHSPREQRERAETLARAKGYAPGPVYEDINVSGATAPAERPGMGELLKAIEAGELAGIAAYSLDRLSREPAHGDSLVKQVTKAGGVILTPDIPDAIDTPTGEFTFGMLLQVAKLYRSQAGARFASAKEHAIANGIVTTNRDAVGYRRNPGTRRYEPHPETAPIVRQVFERRAAGAGPTELARLLEAHGVLTSQDSETWSKQAVQNLLKSRTYRGELRSGPYVNPNAHEPIVDEATWAAAQSPARRPKPGPRGTYLLAGVLRCRACGYSMNGTTTSRGKRIYRCPRRHAGGICPEPARIDAVTVEEAVAAELFRRATFVWEKRAKRVDTAELQEAYDAAERRLAQVLSPASQDALGDNWPGTVKARTAERDSAAAALGGALAMAGRGDLKRRVELARHWADEVGLGELKAGGSSTVVFIDQEAKRQLIRDEFPAIAVAKDKSLDFDVDTSGLSRRGYNRRARLNPL